MKGKMHYIGGMCTGIISAYYMNPQIVPLLFGAIAGGIGGLFPDIDKEGSMISNCFPKISGKVRCFTRHRGFFHSLIVPISILLIRILLPDNAVSDMFQIILQSFVGGYLMHMLQDSCTIGGIEWLYPIKRKKYSMLPFYTGDKKELLVTFTLILEVLQVSSIVFTGQRIILFHF